METVDVRLASNIASVTDFFGPERGEDMAIHLCNGGRQLAASRIPLHFEGLKEEGLKSGPPASIEDFTFFPVTSGEPVMSDTERPRLAYAVKLAYLGQRRLSLEEEEVDEVDEEAGLHPEVGAINSEGREWQKRLEKEVLELEEWKLKQKQQFNEKVFLMLDHRALY